MCVGLQLRSNAKIEWCEMAHLGSPVVRGAALIVAAELMFAAMGATIRHLSTELDNEMLVFIRNAVGLILLLPLFVREAPTLKTHVPHLHLLRALAGLSAMYCFFYALAHMPLAGDQDASICLVPEH